NRRSTGGRLRGHPPTPDIYPLALHDALPISSPAQRALSLLVRREHSRPELTRKLLARGVAEADAAEAVARMAEAGWQDDQRFARSEEHTSELQSRENLVCRLLLEKKKHYGPL